MAALPQGEGMVFGLRAPRSQTQPLNSPGPHPASVAGGPVLLLLQPDIGLLSPVLAPAGLLGFRRGSWIPTTGKKHGLHYQGHLSSSSSACIGCVILGQSPNFSEPYLLSVLIHKVKSGLHQSGFGRLRYEESHSLVLRPGGTRSQKPPRIPHHFPWYRLITLTPSFGYCRQCQDGGGGRLPQMPTMGASHSSKGSFSCMQQLGQFGENESFLLLLGWLSDSGPGSSDFLGL